MRTRKVTVQARLTEPGDVDVRPGNAPAANPSAAEGRTHWPHLLRRGRGLATLVRRMPFTTAVVLLILVVGIATGALWSPVTERPWFRGIAYGVPSLADGRLVDPADRPFCALAGLLPPVVGSFALLVGFAEWKLGTRRAALITVAGHLVAVPSRC